MKRKKKKLGSFALVLHAHIPYVIDHGVWPHGLDWLNEAAAGCYLPLLEVLSRLIKEDHSPQITIGITPVLTEQLADDSFKDSFEGYLNERVKAARADKINFRKSGMSNLSHLAGRWEGHYRHLLQVFKNRYHKDIVGGFRYLQDAGHIEIITSCATHGYLPLLGRDTAVQSQIKTGIQVYKEHYGCQPRGFWLPECAYRPRYRWRSPFDSRGKGFLRKGVEEFLSENYIGYFILDSHLLKGGKSVGVYLDRFAALRSLWGQFEKEYEPRPEEKDKTPYQLYYVGSVEGKKPVAVFVRDPQTALQVWSGECGYPGDGWYLEFHKKHFPGGLRYWRVTSAKSDLANKMEYNPEMARSRVPENAHHFKELVRRTLREHKDREGKNGIVCAPYDSELFGHWWFEGPEWLYTVLKSMDEDPDIELTTCSRYLLENPSTSVVSLPEGSWGQGGFHWIWLNKWTMWTWKHIYEMETAVEKITRKKFRRPGTVMDALLKQVCRELLLLESSDWQFLISTWSARDYAEMRITEHYDNLKQTLWLITRYEKTGRLTNEESRLLSNLQKQNPIFKNLDWKYWSRVEFPPE